MKKITGSLVCLFSLLFLTVNAFAAAPSGELRTAADGLNLGSDLESHYEDISSLHAAGVRVFDTEGLLTAAEADALEEKLDSVSDSVGIDLAVITTQGLSGFGDAGTFSDYLYSFSGLGYGEDKTGSIIVVSLEDRDVFIYCKGDAIGYLTDSQQDYIYDDLNGGLLSALSDGNYAEAFEIYADGIADAYVTEEETEAGLSLFDVIVSLIVSAGIASIPVLSVRAKYAMKSEKQMAQGFNFAYREHSSLDLTAGPAAARFITKNIVSVPKPKPQNNNDHRGGHTTTYTSVGGGSYGGSGRKF